MNATLRFKLGPNLGNSGRFGIAVTADGRLLAAGGADGTIHLIDPVAGKELRRLEAFPREIQCCHFGPPADGSTLVAHSREIRIFDLGTGERRIVKDSVNSANGAALSPDGRTFVVVDGSGPTIRLFDVRAGAAAGSLPGHGECKNRTGWAAR